MSGNVALETMATMLSGGTHEADDKGQSAEIGGTLSGSFDSVHDVAARLQVEQADLFLVVGFSHHVVGSRLQGHLTSVSVCEAGVAAAFSYHDVVAFDRWRSWVLLKSGEGIVHERGGKKDFVLGPSDFKGDLYEGEIIRQLHPLPWCWHPALKRWRTFNDDETR